MRTTTALATALATGLAGVALSILPASAEPGGGADTSENTLLPPVHTDIAPKLDGDGDLRLWFHIEEGYLDPATTIVEVPDTARRTIPAPSDGRDFTFLGPVGTDVWLLPELQTDGIAWLGWSSESKHIPAAAYRGLLDLRMDGVTGLAEGPDGTDAPGELVLYDDFTTMGNNPMFATREGMPHAVQLHRATHKHLNWAFTAPGTYCVGFTVGGELADDRYSASPAVMTFVVGRPAGLDPTEITTCAQAGVEPAGKPAHQPTDPPAGQTKVFRPRLRSGGVPGTNEYAALRPVLGPDQKLTVPLIEGTQIDAGVRRDLDHVIFAVERFSKHYADDPADDYYNFGEGRNFFGNTTLQFDTTRLRGVEGGLLTWTLDDVRAPGHFTLTAKTVSGKSPVLGDRPGEAAETWTTRIGRGGDLGASLYTAGIYCVDLTWSATPDGGPVTSAAETLRFAVDVERPETMTDEDCGKTAAEFDATDPVPTTITAPAITQTYGRAAELTVSVSPGATGEVTVEVGELEWTATLIDGRATVPLPARSLEPGKTTASIAYPGVPGEFAPATGTATVTVVKAKPTVKVEPAKAAVKRGKAAVFRVTVTGRGVEPRGKVMVKVAGRKKSARLNAQGNATVKVRIGKRTSLGTKKASVTYRGDAYVAKGKGGTRIRVSR